MYFVYLILGAFFTYQIFKILRVQTYNIIFMGLKQPFIWIVVMALMGALIMYLSTFITLKKLGLDISTYSIVLLTIQGFSQLRKSNKINEGSEDDLKEIYIDLGLPSGQLQYKIGLYAFPIGATISWVCCYATAVY